MCRRRDEAKALSPHGSGQQRRSTAQGHRGDRQSDLLQGPDVEELAGEITAADHPDVAAAGRKGTTMSEALAAEVVDAYNNTGNVVKKREETHKMAQANRAFAHLKW